MLEKAQIEWGFAMRGGQSSIVVSEVTSHWLEPMATVT